MSVAIVYDLNFKVLSSGKPSAQLVDQVQRTEKRIFPKSEAMDFGSELRKLNTELVVVVSEPNANNNAIGERSICGYLLFAASHGNAILHKLCVVESFRRQGIASKMMLDLMEKLQRQGCRKLLLWVDAERQPARRLYESLGFEQIHQASDYYGPGRNGIKMALDLAG